jgi:geranylgeranyl diphosphate synthase type II
MRQQIEKRLDELLPPKSSSLIQAARYAVLGGGKRLRPQLVLIAAKMLGASVEAAIDPACAIEMVHAYSLIHDDLPCMDDDDLRHGKPSLHKAFPESIALLTGDFLLTYAFEVLSKAPHLTDSQRISLVRILSERSGKEGMIGGQVLDMESTAKRIEIETLYTMHRAKTASLLSACLEFGAILAASTSQEILALFKTIGENLGLAYQILDDLLDASSTTEKLGKTAGSDAKHQKPTSVALLGSAKAAAKLEELKTLCFAQINALPDSQELTALTQKLLIRNY